MLKHDSRSEIELIIYNFKIIIIRLNLYDSTHYFNCNINTLYVNESEVVYKFNF